MVDWNKFTFLTDMRDEDGQFTVWKENSTRKVVSMIFFSFSAKVTSNNENEIQTSSEKNANPMISFLIFERVLTWINQLRSQIKILNGYICLFFGFSFIQNCARPCVCVCVCAWNKQIKRTKRNEFAPCKHHKSFQTTKRTFFGRRDSVHSIYIPVGCVVLQFRKPN